MNRFALTRARSAAFGSSFVLGALVCAPPMALADESGTSFWLPGLFGSLAAAPQQPGASVATIYYHTSVFAGRNVNFQHGSSLIAGVDATGDLGIIIPSYVFATPVLGAQLSVGLMTVVGNSNISAAAMATGPLGNIFGIGRTDTVTGVGDLYPQILLRWNMGLDNIMAYVTGDAPVGSYNAQRLANIGLGHSAMDAGGGYTFFNPETGHELSAVAGFTYNFINPTTSVRSGVDFHLDWAASQFVTKQWQVGVVGYVYDQISADGGSGNKVGAFQSRVLGVGPQIGYVFPLGDHQGYVNLKGYKEFDSKNRPDGWNVWLTLAITPAPQSEPPKPVVAKY
jgi:hypothetical protein